MSANANLAPVQVQPTTQLSKIPTAMNCIEAVVNAEGNVKLACERLKIDQGQLLTIIANDPQAQSKLNGQLKFLINMSIFDMVKQLSIVLQAYMEDLSPSEVARTFTALAQAFNGSTSKDDGITINNNIVQVSEARERVFSRITELSARRTTESNSE